MATIVPAILEETKEAFLNKVSIITRVGQVKRIQVDFGDGVFVSHKTLDVKEIDPLNPAFEWEAHLMIQAPTDFLDYQIAGFSTVIVHLEAFENARELSEAIGKIKTSGIKVGLAINPETGVDKIDSFLGEVDQLTLLSVNPGFQGQSFIETTFERLKELRGKSEGVIIEIDGGINAENIQKLAELGADYLTVGHAIFETENAAENFEKLTQSAMKKNQN